MQRFFVAFLLVVRLCNAFYETGMAFPRPHQRYDSIVDGDVITTDFTRRGDEIMELFKFPCSRHQYEPAGDVERVQIPLNGDNPHTFPLHLAQTQDVPKDSTTVDEHPRGNIRRLTTIHWLRFEGSPRIDDMYSQDNRFTRRTRASETEEWCDPQVNVPTYAQPFGQRENSNSTAIDWRGISDLNATLALRYTYTNVSNAYLTVRMTTEVSVLPQRLGPDRTKLTELQCCHVRFTTDQVDMPECPATATGPRPPDPSGPGDLSRGAAMAVIFGSVAAGICLLYLFCRYCLPRGFCARSRKPSAANDTSSMAESGNCGRPPVPARAQSAPFEEAHEEPPGYDDDRPPGYQQAEATRDGPPLR